jgi:threonine dehydratase
MTGDGDAPGFGDITEAAARIGGLAIRTPLLGYPDLDARTGGRILIKPEVLQRTGSFKFRGACNFIGRLDAAARRRGVVAYSSGNHAQGVAAAAALLGAPATIVMPADAPAIKIANTRSYGATVVTYDRWCDNREEIAAKLARRTGATLLPPYDHAWTIAGQGTVGLEIVEQCDARGLRADAVLVPCGGGGLTAGVCLAIAATGAATAVHPIEPASFDDTARSLALLAPCPGTLTFAINRRHAAPGVAVDDDAVRDAMRYAWRTLKLVVEPGGAVALAALLCGRVAARDRTVVIVLSGGNVDAATYCGIVAGSADATT